MKFIKSLLLATTAHAEKITVAAAVDLKFAMNAIVTAFNATNPTGELSVVYGSSRTFNTQIQNGAPFDMFFLADVSSPRALIISGLAAGEVKPYAAGRIAAPGRSMARPAAGAATATRARL